MEQHSQNYNHSLRGIMFTLEVPAKGFKKFDEMMNNENIVYRIQEKKLETIILTFKKQNYFDKAKELLANNA